MIEKTNYVRSAKLMQAYRKLPCQHCGIDDGSVAGAHSNQERHGKGRSLKSSDIYCASLCHVCHHALDQGRSMSRSERVAMWDAAHAKTVAELVRRGVWPAGVPTPEFAAEHSYVKPIANPYQSYTNDSDCGRICHRQFTARKPVGPPWGRIA